MSSFGETFQPFLLVLKIFGKNKFETNGKLRVKILRKIHCLIFIVIGGLIYSETISDSYKFEYLTTSVHGEIVISFIYAADFLALPTLFFGLYFDYLIAKNISGKIFRKFDKIDRILKAKFYVLMNLERCKRRSIILTVFGIFIVFGQNFPFHFIATHSHLVIFNLNLVAEFLFYIELSIHLNLCWEIKDRLSRFRRALNKFKKRKRISDIDVDWAAELFEIFEDIVKDLNEGFGLMQIYTIGKGVDWCKIFRLRTFSLFQDFYSSKFRLERFIWSAFSLDWSRAHSNSSFVSKAVSFRGCLICSINNVTMKDWLLYCSVDVLSDRLLHSTLHKLFHSWCHSKGI